MGALCILVKHPKNFLGAYRRRYNHCSHLTVKDFFWVFRAVGAKNFGEIILGLYIGLRAIWACI